MGDENDAFYVVRKGDIVGLYKSSSDVQALLIYDPCITVFKGYSLPKETEAYLNSRGLKNAICSIGASSVQADLFGPLVVCPFLQPASGKEKAVRMNSPEKRLQQPASGKEKAVRINSPEKRLQGAGGSNPFSSPQQNQLRRENVMAVPPISSYCTFILEFDGASKGNPGQAGAGVVLRAADGSLVYRLREGLGIATNNVAEYRSLILGLKVALKKRITHLSVKGDSKLVCMQINGAWKTKNQNMADLCKVARELKDKFTWFEINHVGRVYAMEHFLLILQYKKMSGTRKLMLKPILLSISRRVKFKKTESGNRGFIMLENSKSFFYCFADRIQVTAVFGNVFCVSNGFSLVLAKVANFVL